MFPSSSYKMFTPEAKAECSASLARVMEIQRQASSSSSSSSSLTWLDNFVKSRAQGKSGNTRASQNSGVISIFTEERGGPSQTPFLDVYQNIESAAVKQTEKMKPLPTPNFPKLPGKRTKPKSSNNEAAALRLQLLQSRSGEVTYCTFWWSNYKLENISSIGETLISSFLMQNYFYWVGRSPPILLAYYQVAVTVIKDCPITQSKNALSWQLSVGIILLTN